MPQAKSKGWCEKKRQRIKASQLIDRLIECAEGEIELTIQQERISLALINKVLPNITHQTIEDITPAKPRDMTMDELLAIAQGQEPLSDTQH